MNAVGNRTFGSVSYTHLDVYKRQLLECLVMNADPEHDADCYEFDLKTVEEYRKKMLSAPAVSYTHLDVYKRQGVTNVYQKILG